MTKCILHQNFFSIINFLIESYINRISKKKFHSEIVIELWFKNKSNEKTWKFFPKKKFQIKNSRVRNKKKIFVFLNVKSCVCVCRVRYFYTTGHKVYWNFHLDLNRININIFSHRFNVGMDRSNKWIIDVNVVLD